MKNSSLIVSLKNLATHGAACIFSASILVACGGNNSQDTTNGSGKYLASETVSCAAWNSTTVYTVGQCTSYQAKNYTAKWWTQGNVPGADQWGPWALNAAQPTTPPTPPPPTPTPPPTNNTSCPAYVAGTAYKEGQVVANAGGYYRCLVAGWCSSNSTAYEPGKGWAASSAWEVANASACTTGSTPNPRFTSDQADDVQGSQVHIIYAIASDGFDRSLDVTGRVASSVGSFNHWLEGQTGGRKLRLDTVGGALDITFVKLPKTEATFDAYGWQKRDQIEIELSKLGLLKPNKIYAVYYDGSNFNTCGDAPHPPQLAGQVGIIYLKGEVPGNTPCIAYNLAETSAAPPSYMEFSMLHEILHTLGFVDFNAPNQVLNGHVNTDPTDLMYAGPLSWNPRVLDFNKSNYYNPNGLPAGRLNFANSSYLTP